MTLNARTAAIVIMVAGHAAEAHIGHADTAQGRDKRIVLAQLPCRPDKVEAMQAVARDHARTYHLQKLAMALDSHGFHAAVKTTYPPALHIFIPGAAMLGQTIDCTPTAGDDGRLGWSYRWSWGDLLHNTDDPDGAAAKIADVLAAN
jgi:hypothetical protein